MFYNKFYFFLILFYYITIIFLRNFYNHNLGLSLVNSPDDIYLSPLSHTIKTIKPFSILFATFNAAAIAPPLLIPANIASYLANLLTIMIDSYYDISIISSTFYLLYILGTYSGVHLRIPGILEP